MGKTSAPPLDGEAIQKARLGKFLTQAEVAGAVHEQVGAFGLKFDRSSLSLIESGRVKRPSLKVVPVLAAVLGLETEQMFKAEDETGDEDDEPEEVAA